MRPMVARCQMGLALIEQRGGHPESARERQRAAEELCRDMGLGR
jgi:hypothetical protein